MMQLCKKRSAIGTSPSTLYISTSMITWKKIGILWLQQISEAVNLQNFCWQLVYLVLHNLLSIYFL